MTFAEALMKAAADEASRPEAAPKAATLTQALPQLQRAPITAEEVEAVRAKQAAEQATQAANKGRVEDLSGALFTLLVGNSGIMDAFDPASGQLDMKLVSATCRVANHIAAHGATSHANEIWGVQCAHGQPLQPAVE